MRPVNLIPPEERRGESAPLRAGAISYAIVAVLAVALVGTVAMVLTGNSISERENELASLEARQVQARQLSQDLAPYSQFASLSDGRVATVSSLAQSRFDWERVLHELALVMPEGVWLDSLTGAVAPGVSTGGESSGTSSTTSADASITGPSLQISGCADGQRTVARFIAALRDIDGVTRVGMQQSALGDASSASSSETTSSSTTVSSGCQTRSFIAAFQITVAFDAVPTTSYTPGSPAATPAVAPATTTTTADPTTTTAADGGVAATQAEQQSAVDSASEQTQKARNGASSVGVAK